MPEGDLITAPYQLELNGVLFGAGTAYPLGRDGLEGLGINAMRTDDTDRPQGHGVVPGIDKLGPKDLAFDIEVLADDDEDAEDRLIELAGAFIPPTGLETVPLVVRLAGERLYRVNGRPRRLATNARRLKAATPRAVALFRATDPRLYDNDEQTDSAAPGETTGGLAYPHGYPHGYGTATSGGIDATNEGNITTYPRARVTAGAGGITGFELHNNTTEEVLEVILTVAAGDFVDVDFGARSILLGGTAPRPGSVVRPDSTFWGLEPGTTNVSFTVSGAGPATLDLYWRSAWII